jgi:hypothetical protein
MRTSLGTLVRMSESKDSGIRLKAIKTMQSQVRNGRPKRYLSLAGRLVKDRHETCRWQAAILIGQFIPFAPDDVWEIVRGCSSASNEDLRAALSTVVLEHLLGFDFDRTFARVREELRQGNRGILDIASTCWDFTGSKVKWSRFKKLLQQFADAPPRPTK